MKASFKILIFFILYFVSPSQLLSDCFYVYHNADLLSKDHLKFATFHCKLMEPIINYRKISFELVDRTTNEIIQEDVWENDKITELLAIKSIPLYLSLIHI